MPAQSSQTIKVSASHYEFGANLIDSRVNFEGVLLSDETCFVLVVSSLSFWQDHFYDLGSATSDHFDTQRLSCDITTVSLQMMLIGRILTDGRMTARLKYDVTDAFTVKVNAQVTEISVSVVIP